MHVLHQVGVGAAEQVLVAGILLRIKLLPAQGMVKAGGGVVKLERFVVFRHHMPLNQVVLHSLEKLRLARPGPDGRPDLGRVKPHQAGVQPGYVDGFGPVLPELRFVAAGKQCVVIIGKPVLHLAEEHDVSITNPERILFASQQPLNPLPMRNKWNGLVLPV